MGCDIHLSVQVCEYPEDTHPLWYTFIKGCSLGRNYKMFGALSDGVRGYDGLPQRGIPEKAYNDEGQLGDHSFSWCTPDEFQEAMEKVEKDEEWKMGPDYKAILDLARALEKAEWKVRFVYGFDS